MALPAQNLGQIHTALHPLVEQRDHPCGDPAGCWGRQLPLEQRRSLLSSDKCEAAAASQIPTAVQSICSPGCAGCSSEGGRLQGRAVHGTIPCAPTAGTKPAPAVEQGQQPGGARAGQGVPLGLGALQISPCIPGLCCKAGARVWYLRFGAERSAGTRCKA